MVFPSQQQTTIFNAIENYVNSGKNVKSTAAFVKFVDVNKTQIEELDEKVDYHKYIKVSLNLHIANWRKLYNKAKLREYDAVQAKAMCCDCIGKEGVCDSHRMNVASDWNICGL